MSVHERCAFCQIIDRQSPATIRYEDDDVLVFDNLLRWAPIMLLAVPKEHMSQVEMWTGGTIALIARVAVEVGTSVSPEGFRLLSNLGHAAMQSQPHAHLHVIGGAYLGPYA